MERYRLVKQKQEGLIAQDTMALAQTLRDNDAKDGKVESQVLSLTETQPVGYRDSIDNLRKQRRQAQVMEREVKNRAAYDLGILQHRHDIQLTVTDFYVNTKLGQDTVRHILGHLKKLLKSTDGALPTRYRASPSILISDCPR